MPGVIFTQSKLDPGDKRISVRKDTKDCAKVLKITSPNAHLKTRAHWVLGWIPSLEPKPHSDRKKDGAFEGRLFYAYRVWKDNNTRYWGYVKFDSKKHFGWLDQENYKVAKGKPEKKSPEAIQKMYDQYRRQTLRKMKKAWRYRVDFELPKSVHDRNAPDVADPTHETKLTSHDELWDRLDQTNKVPVRMCLRVPTSDLVGPKHYLQAFQNPSTDTKCPPYLRWMDVTNTFPEKIKELDEEIKRLQKAKQPTQAALEKKNEYVTLLHQADGRPRKNAVMKDGKPVKAEHLLVPQRVLPNGIAEFELSVRWAGIIKGKRWLLGKFFEGASGWTFVQCKSFRAPDLVVNPSVKSNEKLEPPPAGSPSWALHKQATNPKNPKRREAFEKLKNDPYIKYWKYRHYCRRRVQVMIGGLLAAHGAP